MLGTLRLQLPTAVKMNPKCNGGANSLNHIKHTRFILPLNNRGFTLSLSLQQQPQESRPLDSSHFTTSTVGTSPPSIHLSQWTLSHRHIHILNFIACAIAISATWLFCAAIPALLAFRRAADSMEMLMNVTREELPDTMAAVRLSGMELSDLTTELSDLGQEIMTSVKSSTQAVRLTEERLRRFTNNAPSAPMQELTLMEAKASSPVLARTARRIREGIVKGRAVIQMFFTVTQFSRILSKYLKPQAKVDSFHVLQKSNPPFVPSAIFMKQGLASFVTFVVTHFNDPRISSAELKDLLLHSISVLLQYKEFLVVFERNEATTQIMPKALLSAFDNRSWAPVTNILVRLCKGSGFGSSKRGESASSSVVFLKLLRDTCIHDEELFLAFLNRLFNTLSWSMTEFSVLMREMQENYQYSLEEMEFQQKKCSVIFDLSCNLARVLEFCTREIPHAFLLGADTNLRRLAELIVFILNQLTAANQEFLDMSIRRPSQSPEKVNRGMILAPLTGIILNLFDASKDADCGDYNDIACIFASMDCAETVRSGFNLLRDNWAGFVKGVDEIIILRQLDHISNLLRVGKYTGETDSEDKTCCICYACEADAEFLPCFHVSCFGCISRHLLNCQRCFFCNTTVIEVVRKGANPT